MKVLRVILLSVVLAGAITMLALTCQTSKIYQINAETQTLLISYSIEMYNLDKETLPTSFTDIEDIYSDEARSWAHLLRNASVSWLYKKLPDETKEVSILFKKGNQTISTKRKLNLVSRQLWIIHQSADGGPVDIEVSNSHALALAIHKHIELTKKVPESLEEIDSPDLQELLVNLSPNELTFGVQAGEIVIHGSAATYRYDARGPQVNSRVTIVKNDASVKKVFSVHSLNSF